MKTVAIIQARMGSSRLPGKVLTGIAGTPMLDRILDRVSVARGVDEIVVATTIAPEDDILASHVTRRGRCGIFRGSVDDVLSRYYDSATLHAADVVVRVTADDPLKDPEIIDRAIGLLRDRPDLDYCSNTLEPSYPEGLDIEVVRYSALARAHREATLPSEREHVTPHIWKNPRSFNVLNFRSERDLSDWRWTVDRAEDMVFMQRVFEHFHDRPLVPYRAVIDWLDSRPDIRKINSGIRRNEGYQKSLTLEQP